VAGAVNGRSWPRRQFIDAVGRRISRMLHRACAILCQPYVPAPYIATRPSVGHATRLVKHKIAGGQTVSYDGRTQCLVAFTSHHPTTAAQQHAAFLIRM